MITLRFRKPTRLACMTVLAGTATLLLAETISTPAHAASQKKVLDACSRTAGCNWSVNSGGTINGCSPHACFECNGKTCKPLVAKGPAGRLGPGTGSNAGSATANSGASNNAGNSRPINNIARTTATRRH